MQDRPGDGEALHHPPGQQADGIGGAALHLHGPQDLLHPVGVDPVQLGVVLEVLPPGQLPVQQRLVAQETELGPHGEGTARQRLAEHDHIAGVRAQQRGQDP